MSTIDIPIWDNNPGAVSGSTPFAYYDNDTQFRIDGPRVAKFCAYRLGYPLVDIELQSGSFYAAFEEAVYTYSAEVNRYNIKDNILSLQGVSTNIDATGKQIKSNLGNVITLAATYAEEGLNGGDIEVRKGFINTVVGQQTYDLNALWADVSESGKRIEIKKVYHMEPPAKARFFDPYVGTGLSVQGMLSEFGWDNYSPSVSFVMMPVYADVLRLQAIELNSQIRRSAYSFDIRNNKLSLFPRPTSTSALKVWFDYILVDDRYESVVVNNGDVQSDFSNIQYNLIPYNKINEPGKQWIYQYALCLSKEILGYVRSKYSNIPIPNAEVTLDGETLRNEAAAEKIALLENLRTMLEESTKTKQMELQGTAAENMQKLINFAPIGIYIG